MKDNKLKLGKTLKQMNSIGLVMPRVLATVGVNFSKQAFAKQGWADKGFSKWQKRKGNAKRNQGRSILVDSGDLRRSIRILSTGIGRATYGSRLVYAPVHNAGLRAGRGRGFKMPKRQFIGQSQRLQRKMNTILAIRYLKAF